MATDLVRPLCAEILSDLNLSTFVNSSVKIFDIRGSLVKQFPLNKSSPGLNRLSWDAKNQGSGIYFIQLKARDFFYEQKVQLIK